MNSPRQSIKLLPMPALSAALILLWLSLVNQISIAQFAMATLLAWSLPLLLHRLVAHTLLPAHFLVRVPRIAKPSLLLRFIAMVGWDIVVANFEVALRILQPNRRLRPAFIEMPLSRNRAIDEEGFDKTADNEFVIALLMSVITLTPGTLAARLSGDGSHLLIHTLHTDDPAALIAQLKLRYEQPLREIFS